MLLRPRWYKVVRDIWGNKTRTILVVLSIAVGVFAVGMIAGAHEMLSRDMQRSYAAINPADATIATEDFDDELVNVVRNMPTVQDAEGQTLINGQIQVGPGDWRDLRLRAVDDFTAMRVDNVWPVQGAWPPPRRTMLIERGSLDFINAQLGDTVTVKLGDGERYELGIAGVAHDLNRGSATIERAATGYITLDTLETLGYPRVFQRLVITTADATDDRDHIQTVASAVKDKLEKSGREVYWTWVPEPGEHWADDLLQTVLLILGSLGFLTLLLSAFLVVNTVSSILTQQARQIGIMKAIGARTRQIVSLYVGMVLIFSGLSLLVAVPLGALSAYALARYLAGLLNFDIAGLTIPPSVLLLEIGVGLIVPLLAALYPILASTHVTVRAALSDYGLSEGTRRKTTSSSGIHAVSRILVQFPRPLLISLRNTFRRKGRLALTLTTLTLGGAIFIAVFSLRASLLLTLTDAFRYWNYDVVVRFSRPYRIEQIERIALSVPGVVEAESWTFSNAHRQRPDGSESDTIFVVAPPAATEMLQPTLLRGRWLLPEDENALVLNTEVLANEADIDVGDAIVLKIDEQETTWMIVGVVQGVLAGPTAYANYPYLARQLGELGRAYQVNAATQDQGLAYQSEVAQNLEAQFERQGMQVSSRETMIENRQGIEYQFGLLIFLLLMMAVLLGVVGGLGLMGTMSINVIERTREVGVMRAIGASNQSVLRIFIVEGICIGVISWVIGLLLAVPLSKLLGDLIGETLLESPLSYTFSISGAFLWLGIVIALAALASFLPAWNAARLTVRDVLAYE